MRFDLSFHDTLTPKQKEYIKGAGQYSILIGPAGTAKSYTALARGFVLLQARAVERIVIVRSAVPTRALGHLPGDVDEKQEVFAAPYVDLCEQLTGKRLKEFVTNKLVVFTTTSYLRGVTWDNSFVFLDEFQNCAYQEASTVATRIGEGTHFAVAGDIAQTDLHGNTGAKDFLKVMTAIDDMHVVTFGIEDIVRSGFVADFLRAEQHVLTTPA